MLDKILSVIDAISEWSGKIVSFLILLLALLIGYEVVVRYIFKSPTLWAHELSSMIFGTFIIIGGAFTALKNSHVNMDLVHRSLRTRSRALLDLLTFFIALAFMLTLLWFGGKSAIKSVMTLEHASTQWAPPLYPFRLMLPLGAFLLILQLIAKFIRNLRTLITGRE